MPLFKLIKGTDVRGSRRQRQVFRAGDVIESEDNLAAMEPQRYERISDDQIQWYRGNPQAHNQNHHEPVEAAPSPKGPAPNRVSTSPVPAPNPGAVSQGPAPASASAPALSATPTATSVTTSVTSKASTSARKNLEEDYGDLTNLTVDDLKEIATAEKVDLKGVTKKDDIVKALRAVR